MEERVGNRSPKDEIERRVIDFIGLNISIVCLLIGINLILRLTLRIQIVSLYCTQLFVLIMVLSSITFKSLHGKNLLKKNKKVYMLLRISCGIVILASILLYVFWEYKILKEGREVIEIKPFFLFLLLYLIIFILGLLIQIGEGI